jgi:hypothetical protein
VHLNIFNKKTNFFSRVVFFAHFMGDGENIFAQSLSLHS